MSAILALGGLRQEVKWEGPRMKDSPHCELQTELGYIVKVSQIKQHDNEKQDASSAPVDR